MRFALCCSGSKGNSFVLQDNDCTVVIDCGSTRKYLESSYREFGISVHDVDACLITHQHVDHIGQIQMFKHRPIYASTPIKDIHNVHLIEPFVPFTVKSLRITALPLSHDAEKTMGYVIQNDVEKLVYITDTGYLNENYYEYLIDADYIILESNHDLKMLMDSKRPHFVKQRIFSDNGHLCNENCAEVLTNIVTDKTKEIILAHISDEANTRQKALKINVEALMKKPNLNKNLVIVASEQFTMIQGGEGYEKVSCSSHCCALGLE